jgi:hypothetical protein
MWAALVTELGRTEASTQVTRHFRSHRHTAHRLIEDRYDV